MLKPPEWDDWNLAGKTVYVAAFGSLMFLIVMGARHLLIG